METRTIVETSQENVIRLRPPPKRVMFTEDTVDNEEMNKKKSNSTV
jgi:hypothetical protein